MNESPILAKGVSHWFGEGALRKQILNDVSADIHAGEVVILTGPSGSGKTTFLTLIGGLRTTQAGSLRVLQHEMKGAEERTLREVRKKIGYVFQSHNLIDALTARQNVEMALQLHDEISHAERRRRAEAMLDRVGLGEHVDKHPSRLSGGQRQRVAIARALVGKPRIVLADEPTGSLDRDTGRDVVALLQQLAREDQVTVLLVTHDNRILDAADRILSMEDGRITSFMRAFTNTTGRMLGNLARDIRKGEVIRRMKSLDASGFNEMLREVTEDTRALVAVMEAMRGDAFQEMQAQVLEAFTVKMGELLKAEHAVVYLVDAEKGDLWSYKREGGDVREITLPVGEGIPGAVAASGETWNTNGTLCVPATDSQGMVFGVIELGGKVGGGEFSRDDEERLKEYSGSVSYVLESWRKMGCSCRRAGNAGSPCVIPPGGGSCHSEQQALRPEGACPGSCD